jgi:hypothetical protein
MRSLIFLLLLSFNATAALYDRGNGLIYDDVLDITWLQDANYSFTSGYAVANALGEPNSGRTNVQTNGSMGPDAARLWIDQLDYGGYDDWRLPSVNSINGASLCYAYDGSCDGGYNNTMGELGHMFYNNLGNIGRYNSTGYIQPGYGLSNVSFADATPEGGTKNFLNVQNYIYWLSDDFPNAVYDTYDWAFFLFEGNQDGLVATESSYSWAVHDGDIGASPVPLPAAFWLFASGLISLRLFKR